MKESPKISQELANAIFQTGQAIILILDTEGKISTINPYMEKITGYKLKEVKGKDWFTNFLPKCDYDKIRKIFKEAIGNIHTKGNINPIITKEGKEILIEWFDDTIRDKKGNVLGLLCIGRDVTEQKKIEKDLSDSEKRYKIVTEQSPNGIYIFGTDGKFKFVNDRIFKILGYSREEFFQIDPFQFIHPNYRDEMIKQTRNIFQGKTEKQPKELQILRKDKKECWVLLKPTLIEYEGKIALLASFTDITEKKKLEKERDKLQEQLKKHNKELQKKINLLEHNQIGLNPNEKIVLSAITSSPLSGDKEIAEMINITRSTVTSIRHRLLNKKWYKMINLPDLTEMETAYIFYGDNPNEEMINLFRSEEKCVLCIAGTQFILTMFVFENLKKAREKVMSIGKKIEGLKQIRFYSPNISLDYHKLLQNLLGLKFSLKQKKITKQQLTKRDKEIQYYLTKFPSANNERIQELTRISRPTIIKTRKKLFEENHLTPIIIPNMKKLGFSYYSLIIKKLDFPIYNGRLRKIVNNSYFSIHDEEKFLMVRTYQKYEFLENDCLNVKDEFQKSFHTLGSPEFMNFQGVRIIKLDFSGILERQGFPL